MGLKMLRLNPWGCRCICTQHALPPCLHAFQFGHECPRRLEPARIQPGGRTLPEQWMRKGGIGIRQHANGVQPVGVHAVQQVVQGRLLEAPQAGAPAIHAGLLVLQHLAQIQRRSVVGRHIGRRLPFPPAIVVLGHGEDHFGPKPLGIGRRRIVAGSREVVIAPVRGQIAGHFGVVRLGDHPQLAILGGLQHDRRGLSVSHSPALCLAQVGLACAIRESRRTPKRCGRARGRKRQHLDERVARELVDLGPHEVVDPRLADAEQACGGRVGARNPILSVPCGVGQPA